MAIKMLILPFLIINYATGLIIPGELTSLLSVAYSNIPPIKKGTDSRVGFGFAFGNHADFQVVYELGPQTNTAKIGSSFAANSKRQVSPTSGPNKNRVKFEGSDAGKYLQKWAQNMNDKSPSYDQSDSSDISVIEQSPGELPNLEESLVDIQKNEKGEYEIKQPPPSNMPAQVLYQLQKLYGQNSETVEEVALEREQGPMKTDLRDNYEKLSQYNVRQRTREDVKRITADLSDVDLD